jgi:hypothetical protein
MIMSALIYIVLIVRQMCILQFALIFLFFCTQVLKFRLTYFCTIGMHFFLTKPVDKVLLNTIIINLKNSPSLFETVENITGLCVCECVCV